LEVAADVGVAHQEHLQLGQVVLYLCLAQFELELHVNRPLSLEVSNLPDSKELVGLLVANDDPPFFALLLRVVLSVDGRAEDGVCVLVFFIFFIAGQGDREFDHVAYRVALRAVRSELHLNHRVAIANVSKLCHLILGDADELFAHIVLHVHEVSDLFDLGLRLEEFDQVSVESRQLKQRTLLRPHSLYDHLGEFHAEEGRIQVAIGRDDIDHTVDERDCAL